MCVSVCGVGSARTGAMFGPTAAAALDVLCLSFVKDRLNNNEKKQNKKTSEQENTESAAGMTCGDLPTPALNCSVLGETPVSVV